VEQFSILAPARANGPGVAHVVLVKLALLLPLFFGSALAQNPTTPDPVAAPASEVVSEPRAPEGPITFYQRLEWFTNSSIGPASLGGGVVSAGWGTLLDHPHEYGPGWDGFGQRYGIRLTGIVTGNAIEAGMGAIWGEDPRYRRAPDGSSFGNRLGRVVKWSFVAPGRDGALHPAYARYLGIAGNNFLSNEWREPSEADTSHAVERIGLGFLGKMAGNLWDEFWPDAKKKLFHRTPKY